uniref:Translationally-controlled tumor protein n=1 Tax=Oryctolagus cuniculus TaxID=9986 RepID=A0A5F9CB49_RABIT
MIIYRDLISHDEMFSDIYKIREIAGGLCLEVEGKMVSRTEGNIDDSLIGGNASAEGPEGEGTQSTVITGVDIVMNHHLQETSFTKEAYKKYIKDYMKSIKGKLEEQRPERVKPFMTGAAEQKSGRAPQKKGENQDRVMSWANGAAGKQEASNVAVPGGARRSPGRQAHGLRV